MSGTMPDDWTMPALSPFNETWFTSGTLAVQRCTACGTLQHPPEEICHSCGGMVFDTTTVAPYGTVASYTVAHYAAHPALADAVPYIVVLVSLDDAPHLRVIGNLWPDDGDADGDGGVRLDPDTGRATGVHIGMAVEAHWQERTTPDGTRLRLPQWRRRASG